MTLFSNADFGQTTLMIYMLRRNLSSYAASSSPSSSGSTECL